MSEKYSVELLHVYSDEIFNEEHIHGIDTAQKVLKELTQDFDAIILVDDYNPENKNFDLDGFLQTIKNSGVTIDHTAFEADLVQYYPYVLNMMPDNRFRRCYEKYVEKNKKIPCSFLTAIWYLLRLGLLPPKEGMIISHTGKTFEPAQQLINILPERFGPTEERAVAIIKQTPYRTALGAIENVYHHSPRTHHPSLSSIELRPLPLEY